jgi:N-methylhydantoinase A/oxoprolinase/acetone carboxylase beta subunit
MAAQRFFVGIDTGGTYTDAVVIAEAGQRVLATAKALTTKGDLSIGVTEALESVIAAVAPAVQPADIGLVSVSTTLATNAVVEGHGSAVAVVLIGFDQAMVDRTGIAAAFPTAPLLRVDGGHNHSGDEVAPLDLAQLQSAVLAVKDQVSAFAVASAFAVRNPAHEQAARELIVSTTGRPVTLSTELTSALDAPRRALTAVLNARLISRISMLITAVQQAMRGLAISCPLMVVKGDGSLALAETMALRPIETVLSGPAASLVGARWMVQLDDFIMSDIGGTTTDIGIFSGGRPQVAAEGAEVGGWRTMVRAIDVKTIGLGGDSEVSVSMDGTLRIGPQRIVPVSLIGQRYPAVLELLEADLGDAEGGSQHGQFVVLPFGKSGPHDSSGISPREQEVLALVSDQPRPLRKIALSSAAQRAVASLRRKGLVQVCGFTPSDAAHVLGLQSNWSAEAARKAAQLMVRFIDMRVASSERVEAFCLDVWSEAVALSARAVLAAALPFPPGNTPLIDAVCRGRPVAGLVRVGLSPTIPVVAVGGPARVFYPEVGKRLGCDVIFAENCDVANAIGAAAGVVAITVKITVEGEGNGIFRGYGGGASVMFTDGRKAVEWAEATAQAQARSTAEARGADHPRVSLAVEKFFLPDAVDENGLLRAEITAEAVGRPSPG